jgi:aspartate/methionine/tyrosine aminotransferase
MHYRRMPIEIESPEQIGYGRITCNLSESSVTDARLDTLNLHLHDLILAYGDHLGKPELRALLSADGSTITPDQVLLTVGAAAALFIVNTSLLKPGDHLLVAHPNYATNVETPRALGCDVQTIPLGFEDGYRLDIDSLAAHLTSRTKLLSLTYPHNPTGQMLTRSDLERILTLVESHGCYLLMDETYREMAYGEVLPIAADLSPRAISVSSLSKTYGLPGIRLGWLMTRDADLFQTFLAAKEQIFIANSVVDEEIAYQYLLNKTAHLTRIRAHINQHFRIMQDWFTAPDCPLEWIEPQGGVVCFPRIKPMLPVDVDQFYRVLMERYQTMVGPGHWFEQDRRSMRIGFGWPTTAELQTGLANIAQAVRESM